MEHNTVLPFGTRIVLAQVDMFGWLGRDHHPEPSDVGFLGVVVGNCLFSPDDDSDCKENVLGGTELTEEHAVCYTVVDGTGRKLEVMNFELEVV